MSAGPRLHLFALCLAAACGWLLGLVLLPLAAWAALEIAFALADSMPRRRPASRSTSDRDLTPL
jgi:hypothetical protein